MNDFRYGFPSQAISSNGRPSCFGKVSAYDEMSRDCRSCLHQQNCKQAIYASESIRRPTPMVAPNVVGYQTAIQPAPYAPMQAGPTYQSTVFPQLQAPAPQQPAQQVPPPPSYMQTQRQPMPMQAPVQVQPPRPPAQQFAQPQTGYGYGWLQDPLYYHSRMMPVPMRQQLEGESFFERVGKNMLLSGFEAVAAEALLAVRQAMLAPGWFKKSES